MDEDTTMVLATGEKELVKIFADFSKRLQSQWDLATKRKIIAFKAASIIHCDGELATLPRNYLYDVD